MRRAIAEPLTAGVSGLLAPYLLATVWASIFAVTYLPLIAYLWRKHQIAPNSLAFDLAALLDGTGGAILGVLAGVFLFFVLKGSPWRSWLVFCLCFIISWFVAGALSGDIEVARVLLIRPLPICFLVFSAVGFGYLSRRRARANAP